MGERKWWQRTAAAMFATGIAVGMALTGAGVANATVNQNSPQHNEPDWNGQLNGRSATQVYSIGFVYGGNTVLNLNGAEDSVNSQSDLGVVTPWVRQNATNNAGGVLQANELWEFIPAPDNSSGTIEDGWGMLRSRQSGKCLDVLGGSTAEAAAIAQYTCFNDLNHENQQFRWVDGRLVARHSGKFLAIRGGVRGNQGGGQECAPADGSYSYNGAELVVSNDFNTISPLCSLITIKKEKYRFATNQVSAAGGAPTEDSTRYKCLSRWSFNYEDHRNSSFLGTTTWRGPVIDLSIGDIVNSTTFAVFLYNASDSYDSYRNAGQDNPDRFVAIRYYHANPTFWQTGQAYLTCDPK